MNHDSAPAAQIFLSYAHEDESLREALSTHLSPLKRQGLVVTWHDRKIPPGTEWEDEIDRELEKADVVLLLVSPDFIASEYCEIAMNHALERHQSGDALVVPVILRTCDWQECPFASLTALPSDGRAVTAWEDRDRALNDVAKGIRAAIAEARKRRSDALYAFLRGLVKETAYFNIRGIAPSAARAPVALRQPIEALYTPLRSHGELSRRTWADARPEAGEQQGELLAGGSVELPQLLARHGRLLIEGQPGSGKTTFLNLVACALARDALDEPCPEAGSWRHCQLGLDESTPAPTPILLRLADLVPLFERAPKFRLDDRRWLLDLLEEMCRENGYPVTRNRWQQMLEDGAALLLLDGLDEVAQERMRDRLFAIFRDVCTRWRCPLVVTSRPIDTTPLADMGFQVAVIEPFGDKEIRTFVDRWVAALHCASKTVAMDHVGQRYRDRLLEAIVTVPRVRRLATNPVMLTCLCVVHWNQGRLPEGRARVYRSVIEWLIEARRDQRRTQDFNDRFAWRALARLALAMVSDLGGKRTAIDLEQGAVAVEPVVARTFSGLDDEERRYRGRKWLAFECLGSGIIEEVAGRRVRFWHLTFGEYLAAMQLAWRADGEDDPDEDWWPLVRAHLGDAQWRETLELFPVCLLDEGGEGRVDKLIERVLLLRGQSPDLATEARIAAIVARLLEPLAVVEYRPRPEHSEIHDEILKRSMAVFTAGGAAEVPVTDRIAVAEALGRGYDPRFAAGRKHFIEVPGCGSWRLGKYLVTVEEYQRFVDHRAYEERRYWCADGWSLKKDKGREAPGTWEEQLRTPNRPVVRVSWYEAVAYCRWLSEQRGGRKVRLPNEKEWLRAASPDGRAYPWGPEQPNSERANYSSGETSRIGSPTPVGMFPAGDGAYGHCDLAGNVWEWCQDDIPKEEILRSNKSFLLPVAKGPVKVLRSGGWRDPAELLRTDQRAGYPARERYADVGFRLAAAPANT